MQTPIPITEAKELAAACRRIATGGFAAVDTEFMRETTYWPKLCLIQMAGLDEAVIADPLAADMDLQPFFELMADAKVVKVFHAGRQDIEIIYHLAKMIPEPVFDTQLAAMVCGFGESVSYGALVKKLLKRNHDKSSRFTDWSRRPLSSRQLVYALGDVTHLRDVYPKLVQRLDQTGRAFWLNGELAGLTDPANYDLQPEEAWRRLKMRAKSPAALGITIELAAWRERQAQAQDVPRGRILKDDAIHDMANQAPRSVTELARLRTVHEGFARSSRGREVLEAIERGLEREPDGLPELQDNHPMPSSAAAVTDLLKVLLKAISARHDVAAKLIATSDDLEKIALDDAADVPALQGWRREMFGEAALELKAGRLALGMRRGEVEPLRLPAALAAQRPEDEAHDYNYYDGGKDRRIKPEPAALNDNMVRRPPE